MPERRTERGMSGPDLDDAALIPSLDRVTRGSGEQVVNMASDNVDNEILLKSAKRVNEILESKDAFRAVGRGVSSFSQRIRLKSPSVALRD